MSENQTIKDSVKFLDEDLRLLLDGVNVFFQKYHETREKVTKIEDLNQSLMAEIDAIKSNQQNNYSDELKIKLKKLKKRVKDMESELSEAKASQITKIFQVECDKEQVLQIIPKKVDKEKDQLKKEGLLNDDLTEQISALEEKLKKQADDFDDRSAMYEQKIQEYLKEKTRLESEISLMKEENERLCQRIRALEVSRLTHCPISDDSDCTKPLIKSGTKRKLFNHLNLNN